ncbi:phosphatidylinositol N-acetylglucosaminyltransferase subunit C [Planococcus citri]|uniref:phosphatidylinositol N-acetylglucosaminyltransferase subunit C n=1 Tax=Planococcus citri TaxID=170843 RepID=UPI0031F9AFB9
MTVAASRRPWRKNLYENKDYPDNYTDESFLDELKKNLHIRTVTFKEACFGAGLLTQQICVVVIFACTFVYLYNEWIDPVNLIIYTDATVLLAYCLLFHGQYDFMNLCRTSCIYTICSYMLSPLLKTLTETIDTDTIYSTTVIMMLIHLIFFDYGVPALIVSSSLSLNAAIFGAVCLASRLPLCVSVTAFVHVTVQCFALAPLFLTKVGFSFYNLVLEISVTASILYSISGVMTIFYFLVVFFINVICPYLFIKWYSYKENIYGPWDEAIINVSGSPSFKQKLQCFNS